MSGDAPREAIADSMDPARAAALRATLDLPGASPGPRDPLPPFFHHIYFWTPHRPGELGRDGHPATGRKLIPDLGLPRRMWAGGRLTFAAPLRAGGAATRTTTLLRAERKTGRSGPLGFVTLGHEIVQDGDLCVTEEQDLVYRAPPMPDVPPAAPPAAPPRARDDADWSIARSFDETLLFRYSALTFNGHRIHYDRAYARSVEGHGGLVVHGPLLAQLLILEAERRLGPLARFDFRLTAPLICGEDAILCGRGGDLWVRDAGGRLCLSATAVAR